MAAFRTKDIGKLIANPFFMNGLVWLFVAGVYSLGWSRLCPPLSDDMKVFLGLTVAVSILCGIVTFYRNMIFFKPMKKIRMRSVTIWSILLWLMFAAETAASGGVPILSILAGMSGPTYKEFGLPVIHVLVVNGFTILSVYCFYAYRSLRDDTETRAGAKRLLTVSVVSLLPFLLMFNRGGIMTPLIGMFLIVLLSTPRPVRMLGKIILSMVAILFIFGVMGNMRSDNAKIRNTLLDLGKASNEFRDSGIPDEFFWAYVYISTPLANAQNTINRSKTTYIDTDDIANLVLYEMTPEMITKRITGEGDGVKQVTLRKQSFLLADSLTAVSVYGRAHRYMGWTGMWTLFFFTLAFIYLNTHIISRKSTWYLPMFITVDLIVIMNLFDNMFIFMGMIPQVLIIIMAYFYERATRNMRRFSLRTKPKKHLINPDLLKPLPADARNTVPPHGQA